MIINTLFLTTSLTWFQAWAGTNPVLDIAILLLVFLYSIDKQCSTDLKRLTQHSLTVFLCGSRYNIVLYRSVEIIFLYY